MAWGPEGFTFGMLCFFAQRTFKTPARRTLSSITIGFYLVMWLSIWALGVIVPGGMTLSSFSSYLLPLKDTFLLGGLAGGVLAGGMAMVYAIICIIGVTGALLGAAAWAALILPSMTQSATSGRITLALGVGFGWAFGSAIVSGTAFWILRLFIIGMVENALWRGIIDAAATVAIIGIYAQQVALRTPSTDSRSS